MQTNLSSQLLESPQGGRANDILRACVHCGFCLSTCPTYQLLGNELDSPRGRIYLIKSALEENEFSYKTTQHLDKCLTCRSCETTCPSGVEYAQLLTVGREIVEKRRPLWQKTYRFIVRKAITSKLVSLIGFVTQLKNPLPIFNHTKKDAEVLILTGCVEQSLAPNILNSLINVLNQLNIKINLDKKNNCCGAIDGHLGASKTALRKIKHNLDTWEHAINCGCEAIISTASGCGLMVKDYSTLFDKKDVYYQKAIKIINCTYDVSQYLKKYDLSVLKVKKINKIKKTHIAYHEPCTLQHGQQLAGQTQKLLTQLGYQLTPIIDNHLCCGSTGTYSIFHPMIAKKLATNKIKHLSESNPEMIVTSNIGCLLHLRKNSHIPVKHWIELFG